MKTALVCGSTQGIGRACAELLAENGVTVVLLARNAQALAQLKNELATPTQQKHQVLVADFGNLEQLKAVVSEFAQNNAIDIVVNNTGGPPSGGVAAANIHDFTQAMSNHLLANHIILQAVLPNMQAKKWGRIVNIISTSVKVPLPNLGVSNTTRAAVASWSKTLASELAIYGITVNNVLPGATNTQRLKNIIDQKAKAQNTDIQHITQEMQAEIPMKRFGTPQEIAYAVGFLVSDQAAYITGINLPVDGGRTPSL